MVVVTCPLCERDVPSLESHHLQTKRKDRDDTEGLCQPCHRQVHALFTNTELRDPRLGLDSVEGLLSDDRMLRAVAFIKKQPPGQRVPPRQSNHAKRRR